jgi:two-component system, chemotaxis family, sensor kinase CheA
MTESHAWPFDRDACAAPASVNLSGADLQLFRDFVAEAEPALQHISAITGAPSIEAEELDRAFKKLHFILGFSRVWGLAKVVEALRPAEFAFDACRNDRNFERGSMDYVIRLSIGAVIPMLARLAENGVCETDVSESVEECARYIEALKAVESRALEERARIDAEKARGLPLSQPAEAGLGGEEATFEDFTEKPTPSAEQSPLTNEFCAEARDNLARVASRLIDLENTPDDPEIINELFRCVHTVKGGARLLAIKKIEVLAHEMESLLGDFRGNGRKADAGVIDVLIESSRALTDMVEEVATHAPIGTPIADLITTIRSLRAGAVPAPVTPAGEIRVRKAESPTAPAPAPSPPQAINEDSLRVPTAKLDDVLNTASEVFVTRIRLQADIAGLTQAVAELQKMVESRQFVASDEETQRLRNFFTRLESEAASGRGLHGYGGDSSLRAFVKDVLGKIGEGGANEAALHELKLGVEKVDLLRKQLQKGVLSMEGLSSRLQSGAMNFRMVPVTQLFSRFPILVRDMARSLGKRVNVEIQGNSTELDKVLINQLFDPLLHILRNSVDHGLESPQERLAEGKSEIGRIRMSAYYEGSYVILEVADDGRGVMTEAVSSRAIERGLITPELAAQMSESEIVALIFEPGFSTRETVSEVSGRGVGMDVVRTAVRQMQGVVTIDTSAGRGTTIRIRVPLTLAVVGVVLVEERGYHFAVPVLNITEVLSVPRGDIREIGGVMAVNFRGRTLPVTSLSAVMNFPASAFMDEHLSVVIINDGERELGLLVDRLLGRHDVLIKQFGALLRHLPYLMGCTILSDSRLVCVLNVIEIVRRGKTGRAETGKAEQTSRFASRRQHVILVVDDSAIQRNRITAALGRSGYRTATAEDGFDALSKIKHKSFAAYCVDVLMPLVDGFEFVERLRLLPQMKDAPVFMMSGRMVDHGFDQKRLDRLDVLGFLHKPFDVDELVEALDRRLLGDALADPSEDAKQPGAEEGALT